MPWLFLGATLVGLGFTLNAFVPMSSRRRLFIPSFLMSWLTIELAAHHLAWQAIATWVFVELGALDRWPGKVALGVSVAQWIGLVILLAQGRRAREQMEHALGDFARLEPDRKIHWLRLLMPVPVRSAHTRHIANIVYGRAAGREQKLDIFLPEQAGRGRPAVVQIHGGAWVIGDKRNQGLPLLHHLAAHGWVCFNVNYRLSPAATFPDHLVDIKRAIAWIREHADDYGVDPTFVAVTGGSAGGHLATLAALTEGDPRYQPGFEDADASVQACAPIYGVYDLCDRLGIRSPGYISRLIGPIVLKAFYEEEPERFRDASPIDRVHAHAPPFLVVHGDRDTLSPLEDARLFVERLLEVSESPVLFAEMAGAQHAFDVLLSPRSAPVVEGVVAFFEAALEQHRRSSEPIPVSATPETVPR